MLKKQKLLLSLKKKIKEWIKKEKVIDVVVFGSLMRGKTNPNDIDLCIVLKDEQEKDALDMINSLAKVVDNPSLKPQINVLTENAFHGNNSLSKTLLFEGVSIKHNKAVAELHGFKPKVLFFYDIKHFKPSDRVRFHYLLRGRYGKKGVLFETNAELVKDGLIEAPITSEDILKEIFSQWSLQFNTKRIIY